MNQQQFDRIFDYCSEDCILHGSPFVGLGFVPQFTADGQFLVKSVLRGGPCEGQLNAGDEIISATDGNRIWDTFEQFKSSSWSLGVLSTQLTLMVRRDDDVLEISLVRGLLKAYTFKFSDLLDNMITDSKEWSDAKEEINVILGNKDWVAVYSTTSGTNQKYQRTAVWGNCVIYHLQEGKIAEVMGISDEHSQMKQLGYQITEPQPKLIP